MKTLLTLASVSAIQCDRELKQYYMKKVAAGKPKMVALNNVRNKIISRAFAVVKKRHTVCGTPTICSLIESWGYIRNLPWNTYMSCGVGRLGQLQTSICHWKIRRIFQVGTDPAITYTRLIHRALSGFLTLLF